MDRFSVKKNSLFRCWGVGAFLPAKTKVAGNCMKWIDSVLKFFPHWPGGWGRGLFCQQNNQSCWKLHEMDRFSVKKFSSHHCGPGGAFLPQKNQSCWKLHEMDRFSLKFFSLILLGGGLFCHWKTKVAGNCMKWIDPVLKCFPSVLGGGGLFCQGVKPQSCWKLHEMDRFSVKIIFRSWLWGGAFLPKKPKLLEIAWNG